MAFTEDLAYIAQQEAALILPAFNFDTAWALGLTLRNLALSRRHAVVIDIRRFGNPNQPLFYAAMPGTTPDNIRWVERKSNVVARFHRSSYAVGLSLQQAGRTISEKYALPDDEYATHGGSVPLNVVGAGIIGALTVSGLPQREDHNLAIEGLCIHLNRDPEALHLP